MNRREFLKTSTAIAVAGGIPIAETKHPFVEFAKNNFVVKDYHKGIVPFEASKHQKELVQIYDNSRFVMVKKYRNGGFTTTTVLHAIYECLHKENQFFGFISRTWLEAEKMKEICNLQNLPTVRNNKHFIKFKNGNTIHFFSTDAGRGCMFTTAVLDECAFWKDLKKTYAAIWPMISCGSKLFMVSTPYKKEGYFYDLWENDNSFKKYSPSCFEHPYYTSEKVAFLKATLGEKGFGQECLAEFQEEPF